MLRDMELGIIYVIKNCPFYIGSAEGVNHLHIQDKTVSREHAVILEDIKEIIQDCQRIQKTQGNSTFLGSFLFVKI